MKKAPRSTLGFGVMARIACLCKLIELIVEGGTKCTGPIERAGASLSAKKEMKMRLFSIKECC